MNNTRAETIAKALIHNENPFLRMGEMQAYHRLMLRLLYENRRANTFDGRLRLHSAETRILAVLAALKFGARTASDTWELVLPMSMAWETDRRYDISCVPGTNGCAVLRAVRRPVPQPPSPEPVALSGYCKDLSGRRFGMVTALRPVGRAKNGSLEWLFRCRCGNEFVAIGSNVTSGRTKSCGCLRSTLARERMARRRKEQSHV